MGKPWIAATGVGSGGTLSPEGITAARNDRADIIAGSVAKNCDSSPSNSRLPTCWGALDATGGHPPPVFAKKKIGVPSVAAGRLQSDERRLEPNDGFPNNYDYLVIMARPRRAFDETEELGPRGRTVSIRQAAHAAARTFKTRAVRPGAAFQ